MTLKTFIGQIAVIKHLLDIFIIILHKLGYTVGTVVTPEAAGDESFDLVVGSLDKERFCIKGYFDSMVVTVAFSFDHD
jgi:hypothetical protein